VPDELNSPAPYIDAGSYYGQKGESVAGRNSDGSFQSNGQSTMWYRKSLDMLLHARRIEAANNRANRQRAQLRGLTYQDTGWYELYLELAAVYLRLSQPREALEALQAGIKYKPVPEFFEKMGAAYAALGDQRQAGIHMAAAVVMDSADRSIAARLGRFYQQTDPAGCAIRADQQGLNMDCPRVHDDFCTGSAKVAELYQEVGLKDAAAHARQSARDLRCPTDSGRSPL
jgi:tetratricopeptide (TPR) repeat protein